MSVAHAATILVMVITRMLYAAVDTSSVANWSFDDENQDTLKDVSNGLHAVIESVDSRILICCVSDVSKNSLGLTSGEFLFFSPGSHAFLKEGFSYSHCIVRNDTGINYFFRKFGITIS